MRVERAVQTLSKTDIAVLVVDAVIGKQPLDESLCKEFRKRDIPYIVVYNKADLLADDKISVPETAEETGIYVSALLGTHIYELKELIGHLAGSRKNEKQLAGDLMNAGDVIVLVTPIDESAPKGRMILPQQQMIREVLDNDCINLVVKETDLEKALASLSKPPKLVVTDSQAFGIVSKIVPEEIPLTSFSILFARYKGELFDFVHGASMLDRLKDGDTVLISEGCTHHRQCNDIGTVKLPGWIKSYSGKELQFEFTSGGEFPYELERYALVIHCGACMLNEKEVHSRIRRARESGVAITNYGIAIAQMHGILKRSLSPFPELVEELQAKLR